MENDNLGQLLKKIQIKGVITSLTGLHIGGPNTGVGVGGADNLVVRNALNNQPYIPGSSLKGKMRSLLEKLEGKFDINRNSNFMVFGPYLNPDDPKTLIPQIFGTTPEVIEKSKNKERIPTRLIVRDSSLTSKSELWLSKLKNTDLQYTELKTEVTIDRVTSKATPRTIERIPAGAQFDMNLILNIYGTGENGKGADAEQEMLNRVFVALALVQNDYLGGKGTRGSGEVAIHISDLKYRDRNHYENLLDWENYTAVEIPDELQHNELINS